MNIIHEHNHHHHHHLSVLNKNEKRLARSPILIVSPSFIPSLFIIGLVGLLSPKVKLKNESEEVQGSEGTFNSKELQNLHLLLYFYSFILMLLLLRWTHS
jgi:hypothetical protein